jgi:hypothetical protein
MTTKPPRQPSRHKRIERWHAKRRYEDKELEEGISPEQIGDRASAHMDMVLAPIHEAARKGEITHLEAIRRTMHEQIKTLQEVIKENEEDIDMLLHLGRTETCNPKLLEKQRIWMEEQRREDPVIQELQAQIEEWKKWIADAEQKIQETYSLE